jgi:bifunctional UDP-N-acetylglucosamine pyrophosphorylase / glucosamine-1-phosphate N-acetyltransferase
MPLPPYEPQKFLYTTIMRLKHRGVRFIDEKHIYIEDTVEIGAGTIVYPNVYIEGKTHIGQDCVIEPGALIRNAHIANQCTIGTGAHIEDSTMHSGCEIAHAHIVRSLLGARVKAKHFCYIGDARIGRDCNIGAGTVFCNYDGEKKNKTVLEEGVFVGSGTMLIAPLRIGKGTMIAAGSVVTQNVTPGGTLVIARGQTHEHTLKEVIRTLETTPAEIHKPNRYARDKTGWHKKEKPEA